jgi:hypothetical protein
MGFHYLFNDPLMRNEILPGNRIFFDRRIAHHSPDIPEGYGIYRVTPSTNADGAERQRFL